jgi:hypothetical protein
MSRTTFVRKAFAMPASLVAQLGFKGFREPAKKLAIGGQAE